MKLFRRRPSPPPGRLPRWRIGVAVASGAVAATVLAFVIATATGSTRSVWNQPQTPIGDVLNRVDAGQVRSALITGDRVILTDRAGATFWTQKESGTAIADELRQHGVQVSVAPSDSSDLVRTLPNLVGLLLLLALVFLLLRRSNPLGNPVGPFTFTLSASSSTRMYFTPARLTPFSRVRCWMTCSCARCAASNAAGWSTFGRVPPGPGPHTSSACGDGFPGFRRRR